MSHWHTLRRRVGATESETDDTRGSLLVVLGGHALRLGLGIISSALLARSLGPTGLSRFSVLGAAMAIALTAADFGLSGSAVRHIAGAVALRPDEAYRVARAFAALKLGGTLVVALAMLALATPLARLLRLPAEQGGMLLWLAVLGILATSLSGIVSTVLQALRRFSILILTQSLNVGLTVAAVGALALAGRLTLESALLVGAATALATALLALMLMPAEWRQALRGRPALRDPVVRPLLHFGRWLWLSTLLVIVLVQLDLLLVNRYRDATAAGHYALALNLALKADILNQTLVTVLLPAVSTLTDRAQMGEYLRRSLRQTLPLAALLLLSLPLARPFVLLVYGGDYAPAVPLYSLLLLAAIFDLLVQPFLLLAYPLNVPRLIAAANAIQVATMLAGGVLLLPLWGPSGAAVAKLLAKVAGALFMALALARHRASTA